MSIAKSTVQTHHQSLAALGLFRTKDAVGAGFSQPTISRMAAKDELIRVEHGVYYHRDAEIDLETLDFAVACLKLGPKSVIGGLSALFHYVLIPQAPSQVWVMVPQSNRAKFPQYRIIHTKHSPTIGITDHGTYRMVTVERAIAETFHYATKMGLSTAVTAARTALRERKTSEKRLFETAKVLGLKSVLIRHWEAITTP